MTTTQQDWPERAGSSSVPIRVALVGLGEIGLSAHLPALLRHPAVGPILLIDPDPERRRLAVGSCGHAETAADAAVLLSDERFQAVILATPPWVTTGLARDLLERGRFVLAEKPIAESVDGAAGLLSLAAEQRQRLQVGLTYRHDPAMAQIHSWISEGVLGAPLLLRAHIYDERRDQRDRKHIARITATLGHGSPAVHEGAHVFDWLRYLLGDPLRIDDAWSSVTEAGLPAPNLVGARLSYPAGATAMVEFGWLTDQLPRCELTILGPRGYIALDGGTFHLTLHTQGRSQDIDFLPDRTSRCFDLQLDRFVALVEGRASRPDPSLDDALASLRVAEQITSACERGAGAGPASTP